MSDRYDPNPGPSAMVEYVRLPNQDKLPGQNKQARFDTSGVRDGNGSVFVLVDGIQFFWARFKEKVGAGQKASMYFSNLVGPWQIGALATEWDDDVNEPLVGEAVLSLIATPRGISTGAVTLQNTSDADLVVAAGLIVIPP